MNNAIKIGVSACLLGRKVRYDGGHKRDSYIADLLASHVTLVPVCPEVEAGMPVPRAPMSLQGNPLHPRLVTNSRWEDKTEQMLTFCRSKISDLEGEELSGFILKKNSPSCGVHDVTIHGVDGERRGSGLFAAALAGAFPHLPVEEEEGLKDLARRENFIERVFAYRRWRQFLKNDPDHGRLVDFHSREKLVMMSHSITSYREIGRLVAEGSTMEWTLLLRRYEELFMAALRTPATVKTHTNVLQHVMGYFKKEAPSAEREEMAEAIDAYHDHRLPLIVPLTLLRHYAVMYDQQYLKQQLYLFPDPLELMLRFHA